MAGHNRAAAGRLVIILADDADDIFSQHVANKMEQPSVGDDIEYPAQTRMAIEGSGFGWVSLNEPLPHRRQRRLRKYRNWLHIAEFVVMINLVSGERPSGGDSG